MRFPVEQLKSKSSLILILLAALICGDFSEIKGQELPDAAFLPDGKDAWVIDQFYRLNAIDEFAAANPNNTRILIQSDGTVFRRRIIQYRNLANDSGWCQDKFTDEEMRDVRAVISGFKPGIWKDYCGPMPNSLSPTGSVVITMRDTSGKAVEYKTQLFRFDTLPEDLKRLIEIVFKAGDLAFSNCQKSGVKQN